jgi:hypothetical protein
MQQNLESGSAAVELPLSLPDPSDGAHGSADGGDGDDDDDDGGGGGACIEQ